MQVQEDEGRAAVHERHHRERFLVLCLRIKSREGVSERKREKEAPAHKYTGEIIETTPCARGVEGAREADHGIVPGGSREDARARVASSSSSFSSLVGRTEFQNAKGSLRSQSGTDKGRTG